MNKSTKTVAIGATLIVGVFFIAMLFFAGASQQPAKVSSANAATNTTVTMPPLPAPPSEEVTKVSTSTTKTNTPKKTEPVAVTYVCTGQKSNDFSCYEDYYESLVNTQGIAAAFTDLKARYPVNDYIKSQCHPITHVIGRVAAEKFTKVSAAYSQGDSLCWSGYYHGVLETFANRIGLTNLNSQINSLCSDMNTDGKYSFDYFNCVHGIGHGLMAITDDQLFHSLDHCDSLQGSWEQQSCAGGVYMENVIADGLNHTTNYLDPGRPLFPCSDSPDKYKNSCYLMQTSYMLKINGGDFSKTFEWCRGAEDFKNTCDQSLGRDASGRSVSNAQQTKTTCMLGVNTEEISNCVIGAVKDFISYFHSDSQAKDFCSLFDDPVKTTCFDTARSYYTVF